MNMIECANFLMDLLFTRLYFRRMDNSSVPPWRRALGFICLLSTAILYPSGVFPFLSGMVQRFLLRAALTLLYVVIVFPISFSASAYAVGYWCTIHLLVQSLFFAPFTYTLFTGKAIFTGQPNLDILLCILLTFLIKAICFLPFSRLTPLVHVSPVRFSDLIPICLIAAVALYGRELAIPLLEAGRAAVSEVSSYYLTLLAALMVLLGYVEYSRRDRRERAMTQLKQQEAEALLKQVQNQALNAQEVSALRHDLKNHLLSIQFLLSKGNTAEIGQYIHALLEQTVPSRRNYNTGNELADGLLSMKLEECQSRGTEVTVNLDMRCADFLDNLDLCVLFGNILDNALEACAELPPERKAYIRITGGQSANMFTLRVENSCKRTSVLINGLPVTAKANAQLHGFGLKNVKAVLEKYGGSLHVLQEENGVFVLTILIPIP